MLLALPHSHEVPLFLPMAVLFFYIHVSDLVWSSPKQTVGAKFQCHSREDLPKRRGGS